MRRTGIFSRLNSTFLGTAVFAILSFGFQSIALPVHAFTHELQRAVQAAPPAHGPSTTPRSSARIVESECDLCTFAVHQAIQFPSLAVVTVIESIGVREELAYAETLARHPILLPPARGPPVHA